MGQIPGQPAAANMQEMHWDDELAVKAQQWANECTFQHDPSRYLGKFRFLTFISKSYPMLAPHLWMTIEQNPYCLSDVLSAINELEGKRKKLKIVGSPVEFMKFSQLSIATEQWTFFTTLHNHRRDVLNLDLIILQEWERRDFQNYHNSQFIGNNSCLKYSIMIRLLLFIYPTPLSAFEFHQHLESFNFILLKIRFICFLYLHPR